MKKNKSYLRSLLNDKRGAGLMDMPMNLMIMFIGITFLVALIPGLVSLINGAQGYDSLNCAGYTDPQCGGSPLECSNGANNLSYNAHYPTSSISCMAIKLYVPYIVLGVLIASVAYIFYGKSMGEMGY